MFYLPIKRDIGRKVYHILHGEGTITGDFDSLTYYKAEFSNKGESFTKRFNVYGEEPGSNAGTVLSWESWWAKDLPAVPGSSVWVKYVTSNNCLVKNATLAAIMLTQADADGNVWVMLEEGKTFQVDRLDVTPIFDPIVDRHIKSQLKVTEYDVLRKLTEKCDEFALPWVYNVDERVSTLVLERGCSESKAIKMVWADPKSSIMELKYIATEYGDDLRSEK
jgi:hypothetical protein